MDKATRAQLLRQRLKSLFPASVAPRPTCERKAPRPPPQPLTRAFYGIGTHEPDRRKKWLQKPDVRPANGPRTKRNVGVSPLTRIAEKLPAKLPRVPLPQ